MHVVTKIFVVLAAILSVFLSALVISYSVNADRITQDYVNAVARVKELEDSAATRGLAQATEVAERKAAEDRVKAEQEALRRQIGELQDRLADAIRTARTLQDGNDRVSALSAQLTATNETLTALVTKLRADADDSRKAQVDTAKRNADLEKAIADLRRTYEAAENEKRLVREQLAEARAQIEALRQGGATVGSASSNEPFVYSGPTISGRIEEISTDPATGGLIAKISVGSNDNVRENMKMAIRRENEFVGNLVVVKADLKWAIGRIDLLGRSVEAKVGDAVQSSLN